MPCEIAIACGQGYDLEPGLQEVIRQPVLADRAPWRRSGSFEVKGEVLFDAPWGTGLRLTTVLSTGILVLMPAIGMLLNPHAEFPWYASMVGLPLAILLGAALFMIRGYELSKDKLLVRRLLWKSALSLKALRSVDIDPDAMKRSLRTFGNGGLFCYAGKFRSKKLGSYRAYATDPRLAVILRFRNKVVVVTPDDPKKFASQIEHFMQSA